MARQRKYDHEDMARKRARSFKMLAAGDNPKDIALALGVHEASVRNWRKRWQKELASRPDRNVTPKPYCSGFRWGVGIFVDLF